MAMENLTWKGLVIRSKLALRDTGKTTLKCIRTLLTNPQLPTHVPSLLTCPQLPAYTSLPLFVKFLFAAIPSIHPCDSIAVLGRGFRGAGCYKVGVWLIISVLVVTKVHT